MSSLELGEKQHFVFCFATWEHLILRATFARYANYLASILLGNILSWLNETGIYGALQLHKKMHMFKHVQCTNLQLHVWVIVYIS